MRTLYYQAGQTPSQWGRAHGETYRYEITALAEIRGYLCTRVGGFATAEAAKRAAQPHLVALQRVDGALYEELIGIAQGANVSPEDVVIANHYTDLRDLSPDERQWQWAPELANAGLAAPHTYIDNSTTALGAAASSPAAPANGHDPGGCSVLWADTPSGKLLAQTWDMHATAIPYVMMLHVPRVEHTPAAWLLGLTGCLGLAGVNDRNVGVCINNLFSNDATVGLVWPAVVRRALRETTARAAFEVLKASPVGSGHHYFVADGKESFGIETSGQRREVLFDSTRDAAKSYRHTNHCLHPAVAAVSKVPPTSTTHARYSWLTQSIESRPIADLADVWTRLGSTEGWPHSVCTNVATAANPHGAATCGAIAMNLTTGTVWAQSGFTNHVAPETFSLAPKEAMR